MTRVLLDTNVVLDTLLNRQPWETEARAIWKVHQRGQIEAFISASSLTDIFYIARRQTDGPTARQAVQDCLDQLNVVDVTSAELHAAAAFAGDDFEDNLQIACAQAAGLDFIVTRDAPGFAGSPVPAISPGDFLARVAQPPVTPPGP